MTSEVEAAAREYDELRPQQAGGVADILGRIEPGVIRSYHEGWSEEYLASIAISLKRIADALEKAATVQRAAIDMGPPYHVPSPLDHLRSNTGKEF